MGIGPAGHPADSAQDILNAEIKMRNDAMEWPRSTERTAYSSPAICEKCGGGLALVGELPAIRLLPSLQVYKCALCNDVVTMPRQVTGHGSMADAVERIAVNP